MSNAEPQTRPSHVLEDPSAKAVARVYALAYLDAAASAKVSDPLEELKSFHDDVLVPQPAFEQLLTSQFTSREDKLGIIDRVVKPRASEFFVRFLQVLAEHERLDLLPVIYSEAQTEYETRSGQKAGDGQECRRLVRFTSQIHCRSSEFGPSPLNRSSSLKSTNRSWVGW